MDHIPPKDVRARSIGGAQESLEDRCITRRYIGGQWSAKVKLMWKSHHLSGGVIPLKAELKGIHSTFCPGEAANVLHLDGHIDRLARANGRQGVMADIARAVAGPIGQSYGCRRNWARFGSGDRWVPLIIEGNGLAEILLHVLFAVNAPAFVIFHPAIEDSRSNLLITSYVPVVDFPISILDPAFVDVCPGLIPLHFG